MGTLGQKIRSISSTQNIGWCEFPRFTWSLHLPACTRRGILTARTSWKPARQILTDAYTPSGSSGRRTGWFSFATNQVCARPWPSNAMCTASEEGQERSDQRPGPGHARLAARRGASMDMSTPPPPFPFPSLPSSSLFVLQARLEALHTKAETLLHNQTTQPFCWLGMSLTRGPAADPRSL